MWCVCVCVCGCLCMCVWCMCACVCVCVCVCGVVWCGCVCVPRLRIRTCIAHSQYCHTWPAPHYNIFPHYLITGVIKKEVIEHKMSDLIFSAISLQNISFQSAHQPTRIHKHFFTLKHLKSLQHVSIQRLSSGSHTVPC